ncbi:hypothetical protein GCM10011404_15410 [Sphingomonas prati]|nr:hypothetical protein GCM10011404_15410 [Sphingomonas prati]
MFLPLGFGAGLGGTLALPSTGGRVGWGAQAWDDVTPSHAPHPGPPPGGGREQKVCSVQPHRFGGQRFGFDQEVVFAVRLQHAFAADEDEDGDR